MQNASMSQSAALRMCSPEISQRPVCVSAGGDVGEHLGIPVWVPSLVDLDPCLDPRMKRRLKVRGAAAEACSIRSGYVNRPSLFCLVASSSSQKLRLLPLICFAELGQSMHLLAFLRRSLLHILARIRFGPAHLL